ncbi:hypothetical protein DIT71_17370 [Marinobacter vulgaris]|uniref:Uncharacterized protein n=1 Tax=Marinobacter vulgaris TaxID=1928331 RepID=A0A2V3ZFT0_9GAMM|nr:hypothetical protein [Marinobacter vulgaris]PXX88378.1 hypothetical protein DIT71_17370 [Marinobacter vulgaris]TSJ66150.1 hypothetical protein FPC41_17470 [Marinobacter vulgaris]
MESFKYKDKEVVFETLTGEVLDADRQQEVSITSSGGGGYVGPNGGYVRAPKINSQVSTKQTLWIKTGEGSEQPVHIKNADIAVRPGHTISAVVGTSDGRSEYETLAVINHTSNSVSIVVTKDELSKFLGSLLIPGLLSLPIGLVGASVFGSLVIPSDMSVFGAIALHVLSFFACQVGSVYLMSRGFIKASKDLWSHMNDFVRTAAAKGIS